MIEALAFGTSIVLVGISAAIARKNSRADDLDWARLDQENADLNACIYSLRAEVEQARLQINDMQTANLKLRQDVWSAERATHAANGRAAAAVRKAETAVKDDLSALSAKGHAAKAAAKVAA